MLNAKNDILAALRKEINLLQGYKPNMVNEKFDAGLGRIRYAFPDHQFPRGAIHECVFDHNEEAGAAAGFVSALVGALMKKKGTAIWIGAGKKIYPPALKQFGITPERIIFLDLQKEKEMLWATEEALKCRSLSAVVTETGKISLVASRRLQLAVEQSGVTGFLLHPHSSAQTNTACIARWNISSLKSTVPTGMPGVGFPQWRIQLLKVRNGTPGSWDISFINGRFRHLNPVAEIEPLQHQQTG